MCGIVGYQRTHAPETDAARILALSRRIAHRGPDDEGVALIRRESGDVRALRTDASADGVALPEVGAGECEHDVAFAHRRFSIVDTSPAGHQPFVSHDRVVTLTFNGEIYNYVELRDELSALGHEFRTRSDTEVLCAAYRAWGVACFERVVGFFALALYDASRRQVLLARDRLGKAPLYVTRRDGEVLWCSEIAGLVGDQGAGAFSIREQAVSDFVFFGLRDVHDVTFYDGVTTFPAASYAWIEPDGSFTPECYWELPRGRRTARELSADDAASGLREILDEALRMRMRADVPVAFELSGGMDSSSLCAMAAAKGHPLTAYNVTFPGTDADEEPFARLVADRYPDQIDYKVLECSSADFLDHCDEYVASMGEPFHSPNMRSNQDTWRRLREDGIRVSINGAGGDELLAGYGDYMAPYVGELLASGRVLRAWREVCASTDKPAKRFSLRAAYRLACGARNELGRRFPSFVEARRTRAAERFLGKPGIRVENVPAVRRPGSADDVLRENVGPWLMNYWLRSGHQSFMGVPIEVRTPFLDHRVVEYAFSLPLEYLIRDGWKKWILRRAVDDVLPPGVTWRRRKMGFPFPYAQWFETQRPRLTAILHGLDCPFLDVPAIEREYDALAATEPLYLWRLISVALWFKRCVLGESLQPPMNPRDRTNRDQLAAADCR